MSRGRLYVSLAAACLMATARLVAQGTVPEYQLKAAYLVNFARFVSWPPAGVDGEEFTFCVLGADPFGAALDATVADVTVDGRRAMPRRLAAIGGMEGCRVLFISAAEAGRLEAILAGLRDRPVLTVSDMPQFARRGGMIQFVNDGERVRFEVDLQPAQEAGLTLSSNLLRVAIVVRPAARRR